MVAGMVVFHVDGGGGCFNGGLVSDKEEDDTRIKIKMIYN